METLPDWYRTFNIPPRFNQEAQVLITLSCSADSGYTKWGENGRAPAPRVNAIQPKRAGGAKVGLKSSFRSLCSEFIDGGLGQVYFLQDVHLRRVAKYCSRVGFEASDVSGYANKPLGVGGITVTIGPRLGFNSLLCEDCLGDKAFPSSSLVPGGSAVAALPCHMSLGATVS